MIKINKINIKGLRGIQTNLVVDLDSKSFLLFGDNGSGKSSITDAFEWFYCDLIQHLSTDEIDRKGGISALRNIFLGDQDKGLINLKFNDNNFNSTKEIQINRDKIITDQSNKTDTFDKYIKSSRNENLILRYQDLINFILASKNDKLKELSNIIGFSDVSNTRSLLKKISNKLSRELKNNNFENQISYRDSNLIEYLESNITSDKQFFQAINKLITSFNIKKTINKIEDIDSVLELVKKPEDTQIINKKQFINKVVEFLKNLTSELDELEKQYSEYQKKFHQMVADIEKINKIMLERLLSEGVKVLSTNIIKEDMCPLCLQPKKVMDLLKELENRISELKEVKKEKIKLSELSSIIKESNNKLTRKMDIILSDEEIKSDDGKKIKLFLNELCTYLDIINTELNTQLELNKKIKSFSEIPFQKNKIKVNLEYYKNKSDQFKDKIKDDRTDIVVKIELSKKTYLEKIELIKQKELLENQVKSFELIYNEFVRIQKEELEAFLSHLSNDINELYQYMNPDEKVSDIKLTPVEKDDELQGLTIEFKFYDKAETPPQKYLSESRLNCLGISFFLTSVKVFNKNNNFFILDDVISSFDSTHRIRFSNLLIEKFSDYQIILLTHENNWFDYTRNLVRNKNWVINQLKWNSFDGSSIEEPTPTLKDRIIKKINNDEIENLGNDIRKYLEHILKDIAFNIKVKFDFQFNNTNEDRMPYELLTELKSKINKQSSNTLKESPIIDRLLSSIFIGHKDSHDSSFKPGLSDFKAFWNDIKELEKLFYCTVCNRFISTKYYDPVNKKIRCNCKENKGISYSWKN